MLNALHNEIKFFGHSPGKKAGVGLFGATVANPSIFQF
jgi:hypothetical protein